MKDFQRIGYRLRGKMILPVIKIISGGQTGVDQAALDCAIALEMEYGGWLPPRRMTETGPLAKRYVMQVMDRGGYPERTRKNVEVSNGTLIISHGALRGGSALTEKFAGQCRKPCLHTDLDLQSVDSGTHLIQTWLYENEIVILNVAGSRESSDPRIYAETLQLLKSVLGEQGGRGEEQ